MASFMKVTMLSVLDYHTHAQMTLQGGFYSYSHIWNEERKTEFF